VFGPAIRFTREPQNCRRIPKPDCSAAQVRMIWIVADDPDLRYAPVRLEKRLW
jgi:hypothetical protein